MMKHLIFTTIVLYWFSVLIPVQSVKVYIFNYDNNFGDFFHQGDRNDFNLYKYKDIDILKEKYEGSNIGGAFQEEGDHEMRTHKFEGYPVNMTGTFYCGNPNAYRNGFGFEYVDGGGEYWGVCGSMPLWTYNYPLIPTNWGHHSAGFTVVVRGYNASTNWPFGFDEIRVTTSDKQPQLLQRDNNDPSNSSNNDL